MLKRPAILCASLLFAALFVFGLVRLFELRFDQGDIYPPYSTLRTDPLGASVLYESLERVPGVTTQRYFEETFKNDDGRAHALLILGTQPDSLKWLSRSEFNTLQRFVFNGGRVVIAYYPEVSEPWSVRNAHTNETDNAASDGKRVRHSLKKQDEDSDEKGGETNRPGTMNNPGGTNSVNSTNGFENSKSQSPRYRRRHQPSPDQPDPQDDDDSKSQRLKYADLSAEWGFDLRYENLGRSDEGRLEFPDARRAVPDPELPLLLPIHTSLCFTNLTNGWVTVYQRDENIPVVVERKFGAGSVVLVADSYPVSNEAMFKDRSAPLLAWLLDDGRDVLFDEAHLGILEKPGVATLMRRYRLHGLIVGLLVACWTLRLEKLFQPGSAAPGNVFRHRTGRGRPGFGVRFREPDPAGHCTGGDHQRLFRRVEKIRPAARGHFPGAAARCGTAHPAAGRAGAASAPARRKLPGHQPDLETEGINIYEPKPGTNQRSPGPGAAGNCQSNHRPGRSRGSRPHRHLHRPARAHRGRPGRGEDAARAHACPHARL